MARILYSVNIPRFFYTHRLPLALAAHHAGHEVHVTTSDEDVEYVNLIKEANLPYHPLPLAQHGTNPLAELNTIRALTRIYNRLKPDLVHHVSLKATLYGGIAARLANVPAIVSAMSGLGYVFIGDGTKPAILRVLVDPGLRFALSTPNTHMIFQNPDDRQLFIKRGWIRPDKAALIRGSGVDMDVFAPQPETDGPPMILFAGRLMWRKGLGDFVKAAEQLKGRARFVVAGFSEHSSPDIVSQEQLQAWQDAGLIEWWGKRTDMPDVFAQSHVVVLPSTYGEGVPKVLIEAAACGRAIVATDIPGCREIVQHEVNGLLVPPAQPEALANAIAHLIDHPDQRQGMGARGREIALNDFSLRQVIQETFALYDQLLQHKTSA